MRCKTETIYSKNHRLNIFTQSWRPEQYKNAIVFIIHGLGEHSARYHYVAQKFVNAGFQVSTLDLPGHGRTPGGNAYICSFDFCIDIIHNRIKQLKSENLDVPVFILGHSMGGALAAYYALKLKPEIDGFVLSSAALKISEDIAPVLVKLSGIVGRLFPKLPTITLNSDGLSHDPAVAEEYRQDPLVYSGKIPARTGAEINRSVKYNQKHAAGFDYPVLMIHGSEDQLADVRGSKTFFQKIASGEKELKIYEGLYHELMNEYEKDGVIADIITWINKRIER